MKHHNVSKLDLVDMTTAETASQVAKEIATSNHGSVDQRVPLLLGNSAVEMIVVTNSTVMVVPHHHGPLVVVAATITAAATDKVVVIAVLLVVELLLGNDRTMLLRLLPLAISMAMVDIQVAMEAQTAPTVVSLLWVLLLVLGEGPEVLVLHQV